MGCYSKGDPVLWNYRSAVGHGYVTGVHEEKDTCNDTLYSVNQVDNHPGEPDTVYHTGAALRPSTEAAVEKAREDAKASAEASAAPHLAGSARGAWDAGYNTTAWGRDTRRW